MADRLGEWTWTGVYSLVALAGLVLIVRGYGLARLDPLVLYTPPYIARIRHSMNTGLPTGNKRFRREIESALSARPGTGQCGRPGNNKDQLNVSDPIFLVQN